MYGKLYESTFTGSMIGSGPVVFAVWAYVVAHAKPPGMVEINPTLLAHILGCDPDEIDGAVSKLEAADPRSRSQDEDGRRLIREGQFLYRVPTWEHYHAMRNDEERRAYNREAQRRSRAKVKPSVNDKSTMSNLSATVSHGQPRSAQADAVRSTQYAEQSTEGERTFGAAPAGAVPDRRERAKPVDRPEDVPEQTWLDWLAHRKAKHSTVSTTVLRRLRTEADAAGITLAEALETSVTQGWQGFRADWYAKRNGSSNDDKSRFRNGYVPNRLKPGESNVQPL